MLLVLHTILVGSKFQQSLIKIFQIVQESRKGQGRDLDRWVDELIDRWAHDVHFHSPLSKLRLGLERHSKLSKRYLIFCISKQYHHTIVAIVNLFHEKITNEYHQRTGQLMRF